MWQRAFTVLELLAAKRRTASANGTGVDLQGYVNPGGREMKAYLNCGAISSGTSLDVKIQESDASGSGYTDITGAAFTQLTTSPGDEEIHFRTNKRYVRAVGTLVGTNYEYGVILLVENRLT
jgi:hypothetical protein